jgi:hypothetical protein
VLPDPTGRGASWLAASVDGRLLRIDEAGGDDVGRLDPGEPPFAIARCGGEPAVASALRAPGLFEDPLPDARVVTAPNGLLVALTGPTGRYDHGVLGDRLEASAIEVREAGDVTRIEVDAPSVIEGLAPIVADLDGDEIPELIVTVSDAEVGARLVVYGLDGEFRASSEPIGQGFRWLHQIGVGPTGPAGEVELIAVRTPHIGGQVEAYRLVEDRLELVASTPGYSSHRLGSPNLDMALLADVDGEPGLEIVVPRQDMTALALVKRAAGGFEEIGLLPLDGTLATNIAATPDPDGHLVLAVGTEDGRLRIFR